MQLRKLTLSINGSLSILIASWEHLTVGTITIIVSFWEKFFEFNSLKVSNKCATLKIFDSWENPCLKYLINGDTFIVKRWSHSMDNAQ